MKKSIIILICLIACLTIQASRPYEVTVNTTLNVRNAASPKAAIIGKLHHGDQIEVLSIKGHWAEIRYNNQTAFVAAKYITALPPQVSDDVEDINNQYNYHSEVLETEDEENQLTVESSTFPTDCNYRIAANGDIIKHHLFYGAQYDLMSFKSSKSSLYGVFLSIPSISHWGAFHLGAELTMLINAGIINDWGIGFDFGPSFRIDIADNVFINCPVNARMSKTFNEYDVEDYDSYDDYKDSETTWGAVIKPSLYFFPIKKCGFYIGPQLTIYKECDFGLQAGIALEL